MNFDLPPRIRWEFVLPETAPEIPDSPPVTAAPERLSRSRALAEVILCSGFPTQLVALALLVPLGITLPADSSPTPLFIFALSAIDTVLLLGLIFGLLRASRESARQIFLGDRDITQEMRFGILMVPLVFALVLLVQVIIHTFAPDLRNVPVSPFQSLLASPLLIAGFVALVIIAGGLREELQRAFLLNRFERRLGGPWAGVVVTSCTFGLGHTIQGIDAAIITTLLGATWAVMYLQRRSAVGTITSHALFNLGQVATAYVVLRSGGAA